MLGRAAPSALRSAVGRSRRRDLDGNRPCARPRARSRAGRSGRSPRLVWQGPPECERGEAVRAKVRRLLGSRQAQLSSVKISVVVRREATSRYVALLETTTAQGGGSKRLEGESCDAIALASSVVIALSIDPNAIRDAEEPPPAEPKAMGHTPPGRSPAPSAPAGAREPREPCARSQAVSSRLHRRAVSAATRAVGFRCRWGLRCALAVSLELGGAVYQPRDVTRPERPKVGAELRLFSGELLGCYAVVPFALGALETCPGARVEYLRARAFGVSSPDEGEVLPCPGSRAARRLQATSWLSATLDAGTAAARSTPRSCSSSGRCIRIPVFSPFARTGLALEFWCREKGASVPRQITESLARPH